MDIKQKKYNMMFFQALDKAIKASDEGRLAVYDEMLYQMKYLDKRAREEEILNALAKSNVKIDKIILLLFLIYIVFSILIIL